MMRIGCIREIKEFEYRVGLTPDNARQYIHDGHQVYIEADAGEASGFKDADYAAAGAVVLDNAAAVWRTADMIVKVKEPLPAEYGYMREGQIIFTYLHLAASLSLTQAMLDAKCIGVAYETVTQHGTLPLLKPMSEIAGRLSVMEGAKYLTYPMGGKGVLLSGVPGTARAHVVILGAGTVGANACRVAVGMGARVTVLDTDVTKLSALDALYDSRISTLAGSPDAITAVLPDADLVIGCVLIPGAGAPKLIRRTHLSLMQKGSVIVDVAIDQGGCAETAQTTYHNNPVYTVEGIIHYCVGNMPGAVPVTATLALTNATLPYGRLLARGDIAAVCHENTALAAGVNIWHGACTCEAVAASLSLPYTPLSTVLS